MSKKNQEKKTQVESTYSKEDLMKYAKKAFGVAPEVVAGALHGENKTSFTKKEAKNAIEKFLNRKVK